MERDLSRLATELFSELAAIRNAIHAEARPTLTSSGLRSDAFTIAALLARAGRAWSNGEVANVSGLPRATTHRLLKALASDGALKRQQSPDDRRINSWMVQPRWLPMIQRIAIFGPTSKFVSSLGHLQPTERGTLVEGLRELTFQLLDAKGAELLASAGSTFDRDQPDLESLDYLNLLFILISVLYRHLRNEQANYLQAEVGEPIDTAHFMVMLRALDPCSISDVATFLRVDVTTATRVLDQLAHLGYVDRSRSRVDGRRIIVTSTKSARAVIETVKPFPSDGLYSRALRRDLDGAERLCAVLSKISQLLTGDRAYLDTFDAILRRATGAAGRSAGRLSAPDNRAAQLHDDLVSSVALMSITSGDREKGGLVESTTWVSNEPPMLMTPLAQSHPLLEAVIDGESFTLHLLGTESTALVRQLRPAIGEADPSLGRELEDLTAILDSVALVATVECRVDQLIDIGDRTMILWTPLKTTSYPEVTAPLVAWRGGLYPPAAGRGDAV